MKRRRKGNKNIDIESSLSKELIEFIEGCLEVQGEKRPNIFKLKKYAFLS